MNARGILSGRTAAMAVLAMAVLYAAATVAHGAEHDSTEVEGARDFRTAPVVGDGAYADTILTGETLWFGVNLVNDDEQDFAVTAALVGAADREDLELRIELIGPTLTTLEESTEGLSARQFSYGGRDDGATWQWYLKFTLDAAGRFGEEFPFTFTVDGAASFDATPCDTDSACDLDDRAAQLQEDIAALEDQIDAGGIDEQAAATQAEDLEAEIASLAEQRDQLEGQLAATPGTLSLANGRTRGVLFAALALLNLLLFGSAARSFLRKRAVWAAGGAGTGILATLLATVLSTSLVCAGCPVAVAGDTEPGGDAADARGQAVSVTADELDGIGPLLDELADVVDPDRFDLDRVAADHDSDPESLSAFVAEDIGYEQYPGVLRGAEGTLVSGAGNAYDQALLLRDLLDEAGAEARLAVGRLTSGSAGELVRNAAVPAPPTEPLATEELLDGVLEATAELAQVSPAALRERLDWSPTGDGAESTAGHFVTPATDAILTALEEGGVTSEPLDEAGLVEEARDYAWVLWRQDGDGAWHAAHPAFGGMEAPAGITPEDTYDEDFPDESTHRVSIDIEVRPPGGGGASESLLSASFTGPETFGEPFVFTYVPEELLQGTNTSEVLADLLSPPASGEDSAGTPEAAEHARRLLEDDFPGAGQHFVPVLQQVGSKELKGTAFEGSDRSGGEHWMVFSLSSPGGELAVHDRRVLPSGDDRQALDRALLSSHAFMLAPGRYHSAYVAHRLVEHASSAIAVLDALVDSDDRAPAHLAKAIRKVTVGTDLLAWFSLVDHTVRRAVDGVHSYRPEPSLVSSLVSPTDVSGRFYERTFDIVHNVRRAALDGEGAPEWRDAVTAGVWETYVEGLQAGPVDEPAAESHSAASTLALAMDQGIVLQVLEPRDGTDQVESLPYPPDSRSAIARALRAGYVVAAPVEMPSGAVEPAWWRIDTTTGSTVGMGGDGRGKSQVTARHGLGQSGIEYLGLLSRAITIKNALLACLPAAASYRGSKEGSEKEAAQRALVDCIFLAAFGAGVGIGGGMAAGALWSAEVGGLVQAVFAILWFIMSTAATS